MCCNYVHLIIKINVWVQGATNLSKIPLTKKVSKAMCVSFMLTGNYMMVIGQLDSSGHLPVICAMKLHNLSSDITLQTMWPFEVCDARLHTK